MANTPNKDLERPAHGSEVNTWDEPMNDNSTKVDLALGGSLSLNAATLSGTIALTVGNVTPPTIIVSGAPSGDIVYTVPNLVGGGWTVSNNTTGGKDISFLSLAGGSSVSITAGINTMISCDGTARGMVFSSETNPSDRPLVFIETKTANNTSPYLAWTGLDATYSNYLILINRLRPAAFDRAILQFGEGGGPAWATSGYYTGGGGFNTSTTTGTPALSAVGSNNDAGVLISPVGSTAPTSTLGINGRVEVYNLPSNNGMNTSTLFNMFIAAVNASSPLEGRGFVTGGGFLNDTTAKTGVRLTTSSGGNWLDGEATLYAYRDG